MNNNLPTSSRGLSILASLVLASALLPSAASALSSYTFNVSPGEMQNNFNVPQFSLTNTSTAGEEIIGFSITVGDDENYFYDFVADLGSDPMGVAAHIATESATGARLIIGDRVNDRSGTSQLLWAFDDFQSGEELVFQADIDPYSAQHGGRQSADSRVAFLNNGEAGPATFTVIFSDGTTARDAFSDAAGALPDEFRFEGVGLNPNAVAGGPPPIGSAPVPEPGAALLFGFGVLTVAAKPRRLALN